MELVDLIRAAFDAGHEVALERAQQQLVYRHYERIEHYLRWKLPTDVPQLSLDKTQLVFEKALTGILAGKGFDEFGPWLFGIADNVKNDYFRSRDYQDLKARRAAYHDSDEGIQAGYGEPSELGDNGEWETYDVIEEWFSRHQESHRRIVELYVLQGYSAAETADLTGETENNVYKVAQRFRDDLRRLLAGEDFDAPHE